jgi:glycosyltransferase involved in cell wall biosynthesis
MKQIRVLQIIDSLDAGGSEMVAVNIANALATTGSTVSYLVASREGVLRESHINAAVHYTHLNKKSSYDLKALWRLFRLLKREKIDIVHSHSSSFYFPVLLKPFCRFKLVWHDHYGGALNMLTGERETPIKPFASAFDFTFAVNRQLLETDIRCFKIPQERIMYLPNFSTVEKPGNGRGGGLPVLKGSKSDRVVCVANFRPQKDHENLLQAFHIVLTQRPATYLYLIGMGYKDECEQKILATIAQKGMQENVVWLGSQSYPAEILQQCGVGVLSSESEGLPLVLIEYGLNRLAVASTAVGGIPEMLRNGEHALLVPPKDAAALATALLELLNDPSSAAALSNRLTELVDEKYSANAVMKQVNAVYKNLVDKNV